MDFTSIGSIGTYMKTMDMKGRWQQRRATGDFTADGNSTLTGWTEKEQEKQSAIKMLESSRGDQTMQSIYSKMYSGGKLTAEEKQYLQQKDPAAYQRLRASETEQKGYENELKRCKTKDEVQRVKMNHTASSLNAVNTIMNDPQIPQDKKLELVMQEQQKNAALQRITTQFVKDGSYARLPTEAEATQAESDRKKAEEAEKAIKPEETETTQKADAAGDSDEDTEGKELASSADGNKPKPAEPEKPKSAGAPERGTETGKKAPTRAEAENTPAARKVKRACAAAAYHHSSAAFEAATSAVKASTVDSKG